MKTSTIHVSAAILAITVLASSTHATTTKTESAFDFSAAVLVPEEASSELIFDPTSRLSILENPAQKVKSGLSAAYEHVSNNRVVYGTVATIAAGTIAAAYMWKPRRAGEGNALGRFFADAAAPAAVLHGNNGQPPVDLGNVPGESNLQQVIVRQLEEEDAIARAVQETAVAAPAAPAQAEVIQAVEVAAPAELTPAQNLLADLNREFGELFGKILPGANQVVGNFDINNGAAGVDAMLKVLDRELAPKLGNANNNNIGPNDLARMRDFRAVLDNIALELRRGDNSPDLRSDTPSPDPVVDEDWAIMESAEDEDGGNAHAQVPNRLVFRNGHVLDLHPRFTEAVYNELRMIANLSYKVAVEFRAPKETDKERASRIKRQYLEHLRAQGWEMVAIIDGKTGRFNRDDDKTAIVLFNRALNIIVLAFHGSISYDYGIANLWHGDWAANWDSTAQDARDFGIEDAEGVQLHRGFANNYMSAREGILQAIVHAIKSLPHRADGAQNPAPALFVIGHSKGAALVTIAAPDLQTQLHKAGLDVHVIAMPISAPKAVTLEGREWTTRVLGTGNIMRINVYGDLATKQPWLIGKILGMSKFVSVGVLVLDSLEDTNKRAIALGRQLSRRNGETWAGAHYGSCTDGATDWEFDHEIMPSFVELPRALHMGAMHQIRRDPDFMTTTVIGGRPLGLPEEQQPQQPKE